MEETELPATESVVSMATHLHRALQMIDEELAAEELSREDMARLEVQQRMLQLIMGDKEAAMADLEHSSAYEKEYWQDQLYGLHVLLKSDRNPAPSRRAALALEHLRSAQKNLRAISSLDLVNVAFCREVIAYAHVDRFPSYRFRPGAEVILYVEIENFAAEESTDQEATAFTTRFRGSYQILETTQDHRVIDDRKLPEDRQTCKNFRRDYYIAYRLYLPEKIGRGQYTLQLNIEDAVGDKHGQAFLDFEVVD